MDEAREAQAVKVSSLGDLARIVVLLASRSALLPLYRWHSRDLNAMVYAVQTIYKDFYKLYGLPLIYYYADENEDPGSTVKYILAKVDEVNGELIEKSDRIKTGWLAIPVVNLAEPPNYAPPELR